MARTLPRAFLPRAMEMERRREAARRLEAYDDAAYTDSVDQGREFVDPNAGNDQNAAYYKLDRYQARRDSLLATAYPDQFKNIAQQRQAAQIEAKWNALDAMMGGGFQA